MEKVDDHFEKLVQLSKIDEKIYYKFVADGNWTTDHSAPSERDASSNINNVLRPDMITPATISSAAPTSSTAQMAGAVPKESEAVPGAFPETPATEVKEEAALQDSAKDSEQTFGVAPIPASAGAGNPIHLKPGEPVPDPSTLTSNTVDSTVKTDKESYEKAASDYSVLSSGAVQPVPQDSTQGGMFGVPPVTQSIIPESSLPMGSGTAAEQDPGVTISSAAPTSTTAQLAGQVPKEPKAVPEVVTESQKEAHVDPEASASPEAVAEKKDVEQELKSKVPEEQPTSESGLSAGKVAGIAGGAVAAVGAAATGAAVAAKDKLPTSVQQSIDQVNSGAARATDDKVPEVVTQSQKEAHQPAEAAANPEAVVEKSQVENELLKAVKPSQEAGEPAPTSAEASALSATAPTKTTESSALSRDSLGANDTLSSSTEAIESPANGLNATKDQPAQTAATEIAQLAAEPSPLEESRSREVSPMSKPATKQEQPTVTTGVSDGTTPAKQGPSTPSKATDKAKEAVKNATPGSTKTAESGASSKKEKRRSFFGKLKDKLSGDKK
ncbi:MAG: hypothetical protein M1820_007309 [Bogoriella megaspora]|nr:MAG: hypothetical protein M1820_007309 [Bogoriella megaspora]